MSAELTASAAAPRERRSNLTMALMVAGLGLAAVSMAIMTNGNIGAALAPVALFAFLYVLWKVPLRYSVYLVIYCGLTLANPYEGFAFGIFHPPLEKLGALLLANLNVTTGIDALKFCGMDLLMLFLWGILFYRRAVGSRIDGPILESARPMRMFALISMLFNFGLWGWGLARGGDASHAIWQIHKIIHVPIFFFLCQSALRGPRDNAALGAVIVLAGIERSLSAIYIRHFIPIEGYVGLERPLPYATTHSDSMLFVGALAIVAAVFLELRDRRSLLYLLVVAPITLAGMESNTRRIVWVELGAVLITFYLLSSWNSVKRGLTRAVLVASPLLLLYVAVGWNAGSGVFAPIKTIRSVVDSTSDPSTHWRDMENLNLIFTIGENPFVGSGFGHPYQELIKLPDISAEFAAYRYHPHNGVLGLWGFAGLIGFSGMWVMLVVAVFLAARSYRFSSVPGERAAALACIAAVVVYTNQVYGDIGLPAWAGVFLAGPAMAVAGKLAISSGAWPRSRSRQSAKAPPPHDENAELPAGEPSPT
jgi:O-antigen ligase